MDDAVPRYELTPLCKLANKYGTDKGGEHSFYSRSSGYRRLSHSYTPHYYEFMKDRREEPLRLLEIGVQFGYSMQMWHEFFPNATIYGWDNNLPQYGYPEDPQILLVHVDQTNVANMLANIEPIAPVDFIIDDGTHWPWDQKLAFETLLPYLAPDGVYFCEDKGGDCEYIFLDPPPGYVLEVRDQNPPCSILQVIRRVRDPAVCASS